MIRNDFVSNSSSSSFMLASNKNIDDFIKAFYDYEYDPQNSFSYSKVLLDRILKPVTVLLYGRHYYIKKLEDDKWETMSWEDISYADNDIPEIMETLEKGSSTDILFDELIDKLTPMEMRSSYNMSCGKITLDTIKSTRLFLDKYTIDGDKYYREIQDKYGDKVHKIPQEKLYEVVKPLLGKFFTCGKERLIQNLNFIEEKFKSGQNIYIVPFGYEGDGFEDNAYVFMSDFDEINSFFKKYGITRIYNNEKGLLTI